MPAITFNTGRQYTPEGQVIIAWKTDPMTIRFHDTSRGVKGEMISSVLTERNVMALYDNGQYVGVWFDAQAALDALESVDDDRPVRGSLDDFLCDYDVSPEQEAREAFNDRLDMFRSEY